MLIYKYTPSATTFSGEWSGTTDAISGGLCRQVYIKPATAGTVFSAKLVDNQNFEVRTWSDRVLVNDLTPFFVSGKYTLSIEEATADEVFSVLLCVNDG